MGLLMDYIEDSLERLGQFLSSVSPSGSQTLEREDRVPMVHCPLCPSLWSSETALQDHIFAAHRRAGDVYIKLNDRVIGDLTYCEGAIGELRVYLLGTESAFLVCRVGSADPWNQHSEPGHHCEISHLIPPGYIGLVTIEIMSANFSRRYEIYNRALPLIDSAVLDRAVDELQRPLLENREPQWTAWKARYVNDLSANSVERRYLSGHFEYQLGSYLEQRGDVLARGHYEQAFGYLRPFRTNLAHTARCVLAVKMNWFSILGVCQLGSKFWATHLFFNRAANAGSSDTRPDEAPPLVLDTEGIWIDPFLERLLAAITLYQRGSYSEVEPLLRQLWGDSLARDPNNEIKLWLLEARTRQAQGNPIEARQAYQHLRYHHIFGEEAGHA